MRVAYVIPSLLSPSGWRSPTTGFLNAMRDKLRPFLSFPDLATQMGRANRNWAETFTWERTAQEQHQAFQEALQTA